MAFDFYIDKMLLPIAPSKLQLKIENQNQAMNLINEGEINILKKPGLTTIEFDAMLPQVKYPFATYKNGFQPASFYMDKLKTLKVEQKPFQFIVTRQIGSGKSLHSTNIKVALEDYKLKEDVKNGVDMVVTVRLKQYKDYGTKTCNITFAKRKPQASPQPVRETSNSPAPKSTAKTHTVVTSDNIWAIAQKYYGAGSRYPEIYNANKAAIDGRNKGTGNPRYTIYPGQVFTIPV